ncbi:alpha-amylase family glycosyl hydrolase [Gallaecimonas sp. GXIMD4217]|uniref:alpha-amylase family glycosyl hydrolase n=1 Tax=Gallaecimonas sp. GXIMD4217 TaxID=3131927 RepID=UPI00311B2504
MNKSAFSALALLAAGPLQGADYYGTTEPMAENAIYFLLTDRFVNGDPGNDHRDQGGQYPTFDVPVMGPDGERANIGYLGGDFKGILDNADYLRELGFGAVWLTPIVDNPDQAFSGGEPVSWGSAFTDRGKTGYHGYWGVNFYREDEHLPSPGLDFAAFTQAMKARGLKTVLDIVVNHGSPSFTMAKDQPKFGEIYGPDGELVADHQNLAPEALSPDNPLHDFFYKEKDLVQLSNLADNSPQVLDYFVGAYGQWIDRGADAFRIDTIKHVSNAFWHDFAERIRARYPGFYMFAESYSYDAAEIAKHTHPENGAISVLDFPLKQAMDQVFAKGAGFEALAEPLHLEGGPYANPYELTTFYDNHDMARMAASDEGFIDAHNWLFTARGIPVLYYGSEVGFMRGRGEHQGNRNYFGQERLDAAPQSPIYQALKRIANVRAGAIALQKGLQLNLRLNGDQAAFLRVYQQGERAQQALVLLNKGDRAVTMGVDQYLESGTWRDAFTGKKVRISGPYRTQVPAHGVVVLLKDGQVQNPGLRARLARLMINKAHRTSNK